MCLLRAELVVVTKELSGLPSSLYSSGLHHLSLVGFVLFELIRWVLWKEHEPSNEEKCKVS